MVDKTFFDGSYPSDHWANIQPIELDHPRVVAVAYYKNKQYSIFMNSTDKRGYRCIALFAKDIDGNRTSTFNMMAKTSNELGNEAKIKWKEGEAEKVTARLKIEIEQIKAEYEEQGLIVITQ